MSVARLFFDHPFCQSILHSLAGAQSMGILSGRTVRHVCLDRSAAQSNRRVDRRRSNSILLIWSGRSWTKSRSSESARLLVGLALYGARGLAYVGVYFPSAGLLIAMTLVGHSCASSWGRARDLHGGHLAPTGFGK
jgi:hypothetical protein